MDLNTQTTPTERAYDSSSFIASLSQLAANGFSDAVSSGFEAAVHRLASMEATLLDSPVAYIQDKLLREVRRIARSYAANVNGAFTIRQLQTEHREWLVRNFGPGSDPKTGTAGLEQFLGIAEEVGELAHALLKWRQNIRGTHEEHIAAMKDAVGDILIFLSGFCCRMGFDLEDIARDTWAEVSKRDWRRDPMNGASEQQEQSV